MRFTTLRDRVAEPLFAVFIATGLLLSVLGVLAWRFATPSTRTEHVGIQPGTSPRGVRPQQEPDSLAAVGDTAPTDRSR